MNLRELERHIELDPRVATVFLKKSGREISSVAYTVNVAMGAVRASYFYKKEDKTLAELYGRHVDLDDLCQELLITLLQAAQTYLRSEDQRPFRPYLATCLGNCLRDLHLTKIADYPIVEWERDPQLYRDNDYIPSIDDILFDEEMVGIFEQIESLEVAGQFLSVLTPRQSLIVRYKLENDGIKDVEVIRALQAHFGANFVAAHRTYWREMQKIRTAYITYAITVEKSWLRFLKRIERYKDSSKGVE